MTTETAKPDLFAMYEWVTAKMNDDFDAVAHVAAMNADTSALQAKADVGKALQTTLVLIGDYEPEFRQFCRQCADKTKRAAG